MAFELIYTSLPSGIMAGRSGFCVAAHTENMPERLVLMVEKFSIFDHSSVLEKYSLNKLCYCGCDYFVLTRSADCGKDYTGRTNFISHHLILSAAEIAKYPNPADILLQYSWLNSYTKSPQKIKEPPDLSKITFEKHVPCKTWGEICSGFLQTYFTNGGRNGVGLQAGFRFTLGKGGFDSIKANDKLPEKPKTTISLKGVK